MNSSADLPQSPLRVIYSGRVQGVGFRWTCESIAQRHMVTGTVRNCSDGTVELFVDGAREVVRAFLADIQQSMQRNIESADVTSVSEPVQFTGFQILR